MRPTFTTGAELIGSWFADVERGEAPVRYQLPEPFTTLDVQPGRLILFGAAMSARGRHAVGQLERRLLVAGRAAVGAAIKGA